MNCHVESANGPKLVCLHCSEPIGKKRTRREKQDIMRKEKAVALVETEAYEFENRRLKVQMKAIDAANEKLAQHIKILNKREKQLTDTMLNAH